MVLTLRKVFIRSAAAGVLAVACAGEEPPSPFGLTVASVSGAAELRWQCGAAASRFLIERSESDDANFRFLAQTPGDVLFYRDDEVTRGQWYYYRVAAFYETWDGQEDVTSAFCPYEGVEIE